MNKIFEKVIFYNVDKMYSTSKTTAGVSNSEIIIIAEKIGRNSFVDLAKLNMIDDMKNSPTRIDNLRPSVMSVQTRTISGKMDR